MKLIQVESYKFTTKKNKKILRIYLDNRTGIKNKKTPIFCFSGGGLILINNKFIPLIKRSNSAKSNKNLLSTGSGKPNSLNEIYNPELLLRELFEEISFIKNKNLINFSYLSKNILNHNSSKKIFNYISENNFTLSKSIINQKVTKSNIFNNDELVIFFPNKQIKKIKCIIHIDKNKEVNILFAMNVKIGSIKNKLTIIDTEFHDKKKFKKPRKIFLFEKDNKKFLYDNKFFKSDDFNLHSMTGHLKYALKKTNFL